jgi:hypothetical protein
MQCDICQGRQICHVCGNKVSRSIKEMDFLDMHFAGANFCEITAKDGVEVQAIHPTLDDIVQLCKGMKSSKAMRKGPIFLQREESTYASFFPDAQYIVESEMIIDYEMGKFRRIVAYVNKEEPCVVE